MSDTVFTGKGESSADRDRRIARLEAQLRDLRAEKEAATAAQRDLTPIIWQYTIRPVDESERRYDEVYDDTCALYKIEGRVLNEDEARAAGHPDHAMRGGGMTYLFNKSTGKIVMATGGGTIYVARSWSSKAAGDESHIVAFNKINAFLADHPEGGDITEIVEEHRATRVDY
jgi:hypothetical protein